MGERRSTRVRRLLTLGLRLYPAAFRDAVGDDLIATLTDRWKDAVRARSPVAMLRFWLFEMPRFVADGMIERTRSLAGMPDDARQALRQIRRAPAFHALAMTAIALGIGATTTIFAVTDAVVFRPLRYDRPDDMYLVRSAFGDLETSSNSLPNLRDLRASSKTLDWVAGANDFSPALGGAGDPVRVSALLVTPEYLDGLGASARAGRLFAADDHVAGAMPVVVLSWGLWQRLWGGDAMVVGRSVELDGTAYTVAGVMDRAFRDPAPIESGGPTDIWVPARDGDARLERRTGYMFQLIARARPGRGEEAVRAELSSIGARLAEAHPDANRVDGAALSLRPVPLAQRTIGDARGRLLLMLGAVGLLLLLACANVANLFLARGSARVGEMAVRTALGASRGRLARQLFVESLATALAGGAAGVVIGIAGLRMFVAFAPSGIPRLDEATIDLRVLAFSFAAILATGIASGLLPALRSAPTASNALKESRTTADRRRLRTQHALVSIEIALALVLVIGCAVLVRSFASLVAVEPGFDPADIVVAQIRPPAMSDVETQRSFYSAVLERSRALPSVRSASLSFTPPGNRGGTWSRVTVEGAPADGPAPDFTRITAVLGDEFGTLRMPVRAGHAFETRTRAEDPLIVVLNETAARRLFPGAESPVGRRIRFGSAGSDAPLREVIGVVGDVRQRGPIEDPEAQVYAPYAQSPSPRLLLVLRLAPRAAVPGSALRTLVDETSPGVPVDRISTMDALFADAMAEPRFLASLLSAFALVALVLAAVGTYGTASWIVARRMREVGIRMTLGAAGGSVLALLMRRALLTAGSGIAIGGGAAFVLTRFLESYVYGVTPRDPLAFAIAAAVIGGSALLASLVPALRAARVDPSRVLRVDGW